MAPLGTSIGVRDSKTPEGGHLTISRGAFAALLNRIKADDPNA
ncbi:DUF397 domain-containing protein [Actinomadura sp. WMMB 499]